MEQKLLSRIEKVINLMRKFIIDSSVLVKFISQEKERDLDKAEAILKDLKQGKIRLLTSSLALFEISNALWKKKINPKTAAKGLKIFFKLPIKIVGIDPLTAAAAYKISYQYKITFYDSVFIALALKEKCFLITANPKHQAKFKKADIIPLADYRL